MFLKRLFKFCVITIKFHFGAKVATLVHLDSKWSLSNTTGSWLTLLMYQFNARFIIEIIITLS